MNPSNEFVLVSIRDTTVMGHWSFRADDELAVARHLLRHCWDYEDVFWALRISLQNVEGWNPEKLLQEILDSWFYRRGRAVLYLLRLKPPADCGEDEAKDLGRVADGKR